MNNSFQKDRFLFSQPKEKDLYRLTEIYKSCKYIEEWTDDPGNDNESTYDFFIENTNLPPGGIKEKLILLSIFDKNINEIIGYLQYYLGFPKDNIIWLTTLIISKEFQKHGYGKQIFEIFENKFKEYNNYNKIQLIISIKNWPALRFWIRNGFNTIVDINGDEVYSENNSANIIVEKSLELRNST